jgi:hypothetical protein
MKETYVKIETAKLLKDKGFDWDTDKVYERSLMACRYEDYPMPTQQTACRWLREVHNIDIWVRPQTGILGVKGYTPYITTYKLRTKGHMYYHEDEPDRYDSKDHFIPVPDEKGLIPAHQHYSKHEDAVEAALQYSLTNLIEQ